MNSTAQIVILGGRSLITPYLMNRLSEQGLGAQIISRRALADLPEGFTCRTLDINDGPEWTAPSGSVVVSLLPICILAENLSHFMEAKSIIAISSTGIFNKSEKASKRDRSISKNLEYAENRIDNWSKRNLTTYTVLRPTMIYDGKHDGSIARIAKIIKNFYIFPISFPGKGLRQPVHADDVATAIINAIDNHECTNQSFNIAGGEILSYREMVRRILLGLNRIPVVFMLPAWILRTLFRILSFLKIINETRYGPELFDRMNEDMVFYCEDGLQALKYNPRKFKPLFD